MSRFTKVLVANRGEIACRILRSVHAKGYRSVAIFSDADREAPHVALADEAVHIGPAPVTQSYLDLDRVLGAARASGADAIHPGYGFWSEKADFIEACLAAGLVVIGPDPQSVRSMGDKAEAKRQMIAAGVPCVPGYHGKDQSDECLTREAEAIGYPLMVKAAAGGGGKGMRLVTAGADLATALRTARSEARNAFGDDVLILERAIIEPRHVEIQVFGDSFGNVIHLGERDCSIQRRHQKVIEEAPSPAVGPELRERMGSAAVLAARSIDYVGAGTIEFLLGQDGSFYFLEMNTRLQVEHPVTEHVTGIDLVALQLDVAAGKPLPITQDEVRISGHAMEARLYAEDPANDFLPQTGHVALWEPATGPGVRVDAGIRTGGEVSPYYDPMLAKIVAWGDDREEARLRLLRAVERTSVLGLSTNKSFLAAALSEPEFASGQATTAFIARAFPDGFGGDGSPPRDLIAVAAALLASQHGDGWTTNRWIRNDIAIEAGNESFALSVSRSTGQWLVDDGNGDPLAIVLLGNADGWIDYAVGAARRRVRHVPSGNGFFLEAEGRGWRFVDSTLAGPDDSAQGSDGVLRAPMSGVITLIGASVGDLVERGQSLMTMEAMKMEHQITAAVRGRIEAVHVAAGTQVANNDVLIVIAAEDAA